MILKEKKKIQQSTSSPYLVIPKRFLEILGAGKGTEMELAFDIEKRTITIKEAVKSEKSNS